MRTGRCAQIIHQQQQRVESNLFDVAVLSIFLMTDSKKDEPQGSAGGGRKGLVYALAFHGMGKGEL